MIKSISYRKMKLGTAVVLLAVIAAKTHAVEFSYGETTKPDTIDPYTSHESSAKRLSDLLFDSLFVTDIGGVFKPHLVKEYELSSTGTTINVTLHNNIYWNSPTGPSNHQLSCNDIKTTVRLITTLSSEIPNQDRYLDLKGVEFTSPLTCKINFQRALSNPLQSLTFKILPHHILEGQPSLSRSTSFNKSPIGTGPYYFSKSNDQGEVLLLANNSYFLGKPKIDRIIMKNYADHNIMAQSLMYKSLDLMTYVSPRDLGEIMGDQSIGVVPYDALSFTFIALNNKDKFLKDRRIRQAINYAINRGEMLDAFFNNKGTIISGPFPPTSWAYNLDVKPYAYDKDRAIELLGASGLTKVGNYWVDSNNDNFELEFVVPIGGESETIKRISLAVQGYLSEVGIKVSLKFMEWSQWKTKVIGNHDFQMTIASWSFDDSSNITSIFHSGYAKPWGNNFVSFGSDEVDILLTEANSTNDFEKKRLIYQNLHGIISNEAPYAFLWTLMHHAAHQSKVKNLTIDPNSFFSNIRKWSINTESSNEQTSQ